MRVREDMPNTNDPSLVTEEHCSWPYRGARVRDPSPAEAVVQAAAPEAVRHVGQHHDHGAVVQ